jgi:cytoskeletal protein RodZ
MRTAGEVLKEARLKKGLSLEEVEKLTKIRVKFLKLIEADEYSKFPEGVTTKGFLRNYTQVLDLNPESVLAIFRRDFLEDEKGQIIPRGMVAPLDKFTFRWNPRLTLFLTVGVSLFLFFGYLIMQYLNFITVPKINLVYPPENEVIKTKEVDFLGETDKDASFYINGEIVNLKENGEFSKKVSLLNGENEVIFEAIRRNGKKSRIIRKIKVELPEGE